MINITETAQEHFVKLLSQQAEGTSIRVFVVNQEQQVLNVAFLIALLMQ